MAYWTTCKYAIMHIAKLWISQLADWTNHGLNSLRLLPAVCIVTIKQVCSAG